MSSSPISSSSSESRLVPAGQGSPASAAPGAFGAFLDVRLPVSVILGTGSLSVRQCLALAPRSVLRLRQSAGEDVLVLAGDVPVARAEVMILDEGTAVRVTEVLPPVAQEAS